MRGPLALALVLAAAAPAAGEIDNTKNGIATTERWGGGIRLTGLSGIGVLPGVNSGGEVAGQLRRDEYFVELALGRWKPEDRHMVEDGNSAPIPLAMNDAPGIPPKHCPFRVREQKTAEKGTTEQTFHTGSTSRSARVFHAAQGGETKPNR